MKRYLKLYLHFFKNCWAREMEFRSNLIIWTTMDFIWFFLIVFFVEMVFGQVKSIAGWTKNEILLVILFQQLFLDVLWTFVLQNVLGLSRLIRRGELDFVLLKPVNSRFWASFRFFEFDHYLRMVAIIYLIIRTIVAMNLTIFFINVIGTIFLFVLGILIFYSFFYLLATTNFWFVNIFNLGNLFDEIIDVGKMPVYIFNKGLRFVFTFLIPVAFIATFPVQTLLGKNSPILIIYGLLMGGFLFVLSEWFWRYALKHYSSASS